MIITMESTEKRRIAFTCKGCGEKFVKEIPEEVFIGVQQKSLALTYLQSKREVGCTVVVTVVSVSCPKCKTKKNLMENAGSVKTKKEENRNQVVIDPRDFWESIEDKSLGAWSVN